jgi:uncharacterized membrane protein
MWMHDVEEGVRGKDGKMAEYDTFLLFAGVYPDAASAEEDYEAVKDIYYTTGLIDTFDAAVLAKDEKGRVRIARKHEQSTRHGGWVGAGWGLATGLAIALFPAAAIGGGLLAATTGAGAAIGAITGHVTGGMSRSDLKELGEELDVGEAALIVAAASDMEAKVEAALKKAEKIMKKEAKIESKELKKEVESLKD